MRQRAEIADEDRHRPRPEVPAISIRLGTDQPDKRADKAAQAEPEILRQAERDDEVPHGIAGFGKHPAAANARGQDRRRKPVGERLHSIEVFGQRRRKSDVTSGRTIGPMIPPNRTDAPS